MTREEFDAFLEKSCREYVKVSPKFQGKSFEDATQEAISLFYSEIAALGFDTPGHFFLNIRTETNIIGYFHIGEESSSPKDHIFIWDFEIFEEFRGRKLSKLALDEAFIFLKAKGFKQINLNVFCQNKVALELYEAMDFQPIQLHMSRRL